MKKPFVPNKLPVLLSERELVQILKKERQASVALEKYQQMLKHSVIHERILILFSMDESIQSTKIEGTQATFDEVLEANFKKEISVDVQEVRNYIEAIETGVYLLQNLPLSTRLILNLHKIILKNARGQFRNPGEFRKIQNFIGPTTKIEDASYIPPQPQYVQEYMSNLDQYMNNAVEDDFGPLARAAIIHAQFETIHPFLDGNGRLGRILIILYLLNQNVIDSPSFFISQQLEKNKYKYYALLNDLRTESPKWCEWIQFFLDASIMQSEYYIDKLTKIEQLYHNLNEYASANGVRRDVVEYIFQYPVFSIRSLASELNISYNTARVSVSRLEKNGKIYSGSQKRNRTYHFYDLLEIVR